MQSPRTIHADRPSPEQRSPTAFNTNARNYPPSRTETARTEDQHRHEQPLSTPQSQQNLPSFSDVFDSHRFMPGGSQQLNEPSSYFPRGSLPNSPGPPPGLVGGDRRYPPALKKEQSSAGSISSASTASSYGYPRTPTDGPLPIQALLSSSSSHSYNEAGQPHHPYPTGSLPVHQKQPQHQQQPPALASQAMTNGMPWRKLPSLSREAADEAVVGYHRALSLAHEPPRVANAAAPNAAHSAAATSHSISAVYGIPPPPQHHQMGPGQTQHQQQQQQYHHHKQQQSQQQDRKPEGGNPNFDGMSALLKAGEIVDRRTH